MGGEKMFGSVTLEQKRKAIERDKRRCFVCRQYFAEHRPLDVVVNDPDKAAVIVRDEDLITVCYTCKAVLEEQWRKRVNPEIH